MLNRIMGLFGLKVVKEEKVAETVKATPRKVAEVKEYKSIDSMKLNSEEEREALKNSVESIQAEILDKGYRAIPSILAEYETSAISHFCMLQEIQLGSFDREKDTLEGLTRKQLMDRVAKNNNLQFRMQKIAKGEIPMASEKQLKLIKDIATEHNYAIDMSKIKNGFDASDTIEFLQEKFGIVKKEFKNTPTAKQITAVKNLCRRLNLEVAADMVDTFENASKTIGELAVLVPEEAPKPASEKQVDYACRLWKMLGHRPTAKKKEAFAAMDSKTISALIKTYNEEYYTMHPEANLPREEQLSFIKQLCEQTLQAVPSEMPKTKEEASRLINKLMKDKLYIQTRISSPSLSRDEINAMPDATVKELLANIALERKTRFYTDNTQGTGGAEKGDIAF